MAVCRAASMEQKPCIVRAVMNRNVYSCPYACPERKLSEEERSGRTSLWYLAGLTGLKLDGLEVWRE